MTSRRIRRAQHVLPSLWDHHSRRKASARIQRSNYLPLGLSWERVFMRNTSLRRILALAGVCLLLPQLALPQVPRQSGTLTVTGYPGQVPVIQVNGRSYVELESLARLTSSSISFRAKQIILTLPASAGNTAAPEKNQPVGFSKEFLTRHQLGRQYIPVDHYFVMGEERVNQDISEHIGIHPSDTLERAR